MAGRIYSVGYEGFTLEAFVDRLVGNHVTVVVDVRLNPVSRRPGFSRRKLTAALETVGIAYIHEKALGNPTDNRDSFRSGDGEEGRQRMRAILDNGSDEALDRVVELASERRIALLCVERDPHRCHREVITEAAVTRNAELEIFYIR